MSIEDHISSVHKKFGRESLMKLSDQGICYEGVSTGSLLLDRALGGSGLARRRIIELFGPESSGKTTLALSVIANVQKAGGVAVIIDAEHALDPMWAHINGVNLEELLISQPTSGEEALQIAEMLISSSGVDLVVVDSVAALCPTAELNGEIGDSHVGLLARLMSQAMRKLSGKVSKSNVCMVFINQIREKIGVTWGSNETTPGGRALKFYASQRIDIRKIQTLKAKDGEPPLGIKVRAKVVKNKMAPPFRQAEFTITNKCGLDTKAELFDIGLEIKAIQQGGSWYSFDNIKLGQGREHALDGLTQEMQDAIKTQFFSA